MVKRSTKDKAEGIFHEWKGTIKSKAGKLTNNRRLKAEGMIEKIAGKIQKKIGQVERAVEKPRASAARKPAAKSRRPKE